MYLLGIYSDHGQVEGLPVPLAKYWSMCTFALWLSFRQLLPSSEDNVADILHVNIFTGQRTPHNNMSIEAVEHQNVVKKYVLNARYHIYIILCMYT